MAFSITLSNTIYSSSSSASMPKIQYASNPILPPHLRLLVRAQSAAESGNSSEQNPAETKAKGKNDAGSNAQPATATATATPKRPQKPVYSMKKGQIVRVDKEKYLNSVNQVKFHFLHLIVVELIALYLSVGHPPYYKGLDYIYEDRGEVLDLRMFETGEHALVAWVGIPTAPAWLPTDMLIKSDQLNYERM